MKLNSATVSNVQQISLSLTVPNPGPLRVSSIEATIEGTDFTQLSEIGELFLSFVNSLPKPRLIFIVGGEEVTQMQLKDNGSLSVVIAATDAKGNPTSLDPAAVPAWAVSDPTFGTIVPAANGLSAIFTPSGKLGDLQVQCSVPAVNGEPALAGSLPVTVIASTAVALTLSGTAS